jgi:hypothetical protein
VFIEEQWLDSSIWKHMKNRNEKKYKKGIKHKICGDITNKEIVAWKVAFKINHKLDY